MEPIQHIPPAEIPLWIELIKTLGYVAGVALPAYFAYKTVRARKDARDGNNN